MRTTLILIVCLLALAARAEEPAAIVAKYLPPKASHALVRADGDEGVIGLGTSLYEGDQVQVAAGGSVVIAFADGNEEELQGPATMTVPASEPMGAAARIFGRLQGLLGRKYRQGSNLATRNPGVCPDDGSDAATLEAPVLSPVTRLVAGHENLSLAWVGGCAPYTLSLDAATPATQQNLKRPLARLQTGNLAPGEYTLTIRDAQAQSVEVRVVVSDALPAGPLAADASSEVDAVAFAAWLANHDDGAWRWESFQQLRPWIRGGGVMAGTYGDLVMWGDPSLEDSAAD